MAGGLVALLVAAVASVFWPGVPMYDTVGQYEQVVSGEVEDWHPPVMVRLWQLLRLSAPGTDPMFILQVTLYALGFALLVSALMANGRRWQSAATALLAVSPLLLGWQMVVLKDAQMLGALTAALGIVAHFRMRGQRVPRLASMVVLVLLAYATLVRANALFATVPLAAFLSERPRHAAARAGLAIAAVLVLLAVEPLINHRIFGASPSGVAKSQPLFDLAAIAAATPSSVAPFSREERDQLVSKHCIKPFFWDPLGDPSACGPVTERANDLPEHVLYADLASAALRHPFVYANHRLRHWNSTERWLVAPGLIGAAPPRLAEPNDEGLEGPKSPLAPAWQGIAAWETRTPLGWPITWTALALLLLPAAWAERFRVERGIALALLVSAVALEASFLVISIASDLRYHLWSMTATPLALILLSGSGRAVRKHVLFAGVIVAIVVAGGLFTRMMLPAAPSGYQAMLHA